MDPWRNQALQNAKLQAILSSFRSSAHSRAEQDTPQEQSDMPAPPAYHMVVDPEARTPTMASPYDAETGEEREDSEDETPEVTINAATQIRGTGNIISIAQMDSARIANLVATILSGDSTPSDATTPTLPTTPPPPARVTSLRSTRTEKRRKGGLNVNITVNCGATIIGDRNIVGPGLGDIARQMQLAQRNAAIQAQQSQQQSQMLQQQKLAQVAQAQAQKQAQMNLRHSVERRGDLPGLAQCHQNLYQSQAGLAGVGGLTGQITPPMSRSGSFGSEGSPKGKRKAEDDAGEGLLMLKRRC